MARITNARLRRLESGQSLTDAGLTARRQTENGTITLHFTYRHAGRQRWYRLGTWGQITLFQARVAIRKLAAQVAVGVDVQSERMKERAEGTVAELCLDHIRRAEARKIDTKRPKKQSTLVKDSGRIENHIVGTTFGALKVSAVTRSDVQTLVRSSKRMYRPRSHVASPACSAASSPKRSSSASLTIRPAPRSNCPATASASVICLPDEYAKLWTYTRGPAMPEIVRQAIRFAAFTGWRRSEITGLCFDGISNGVAKLDNTKTGPSRRWLSVQAMRCVGIMSVQIGNLYRKGGASAVQLLERGEGRRSVPGA